jgi:hypothetical protein
MESGWDVIYGKAVYIMSLINAVSRGLLPCIRSAIEVSPSLQNQCLFAVIQRAMSEQMQSTCPESMTVSSKKQKIEIDSSAKNVTVKSIVDDMILYGISGVDWSTCERMNSRIERSSRTGRSIAYFCFM